MNKTIIIGNIGADAEIRETIKDGVSRKFITFSIAYTEKYGGQDVTTWYRVFVQNEKTVESKLIDYLKKGTKVLIEARLTAQTWTKEDGTIMVNYILNVFPSGIELLGSPQGQNGSASSDPPPLLYQQNSSQPNNQGSALSQPDTEDDLPF